MSVELEEKRKHLILSQSKLNRAIFKFSGVFR